MNETTLSVAYHEAGHAVVFLYFGVRVDELPCGPEGGHCRPSRTPSPRVCSLVSVAGSLAAQMAGLPDARYPSDADVEYGLEALGDLACCPEENKTRLVECERLLAKCWPQVEYLARELAAGGLDADSLGALCRRPGSPLAMYAPLYPGSDCRFERTFQQPTRRRLRRSSGVVTVSSHRGIF